jgi:hypothetical protein
MVADQMSFPSWLAIAHSTFAMLKFNLMYITIGWLVLAVILNKTIFRSQPGGLNQKGDGERMSERALLASH